MEKFGDRPAMVRKEEVIVPYLASQESRTTPKPDRCINVYVKYRNTACDLDMRGEYSRIADVVQR